MRHVVSATPFYNESLEERAHSHFPKIRHTRGVMQQPFGAHNHQGLCIWPMHLPPQNMEVLCGRGGHGHNQVVLPLGEAHHPGRHNFIPHSLRDHVLVFAVVSNSRSAISSDTCLVMVSWSAQLWCRLLLIPETRIVPAPPPSRPCSRYRSHPYQKR